MGESEKKNPFQRYAYSGGDPREYMENFDIVKANNMENSALHAYVNNQKIDIESITGSVSVEVTPEGYKVMDSDPSYRKGKRTITGIIKGEGIENLIDDTLIDLTLIAVNDSGKVAKCTLFGLSATSKNSGEVEFKALQVSPWKAVEEVK